MRSWVWVLLSCMFSCVGTRTGNPGNAGGPDGADVARSNLARTSAPQLSAADVSTFGADNRAFALDLYRLLAQTQDNLFFSPYSISTALAMTYAGANGATATEMSGALHFTLAQPRLHEAFNATAYALDARAMQLVSNVVDESFSGDGFKLSTYNQAWSRKGVNFLSSYLDVLAQNYAAGLFLLDFSDPERARALINRWVAEKTDERVEQLLPEGSLSPSTPLVLTNAIYFKGSWLWAFDDARTDTAAFADSQVRMMHTIDTMNYAELEGFRMVKLPYLSPAVSMLAILPPAADLGQAAQRLDLALFDSLRGRLSQHLVSLSLPKWQFSTSVALKEPLTKLGMEAAFDKSAADFSKMTGQRGLFVGQIYHQAFVAVDERGTEAAAATAVVFGDAGVLDPAVEPIELSFDRPFMFAIYDEPTGQILFMGQLVQP